MTSASRLASLKRLNSLRRRTLLVLWVERGLRALFWPVMVAAFYLVVALFGMANGFLLMAAALLSLGLLGFGIFRFRAPTAYDAEARIEFFSALPHRPFDAVADRPAHDDAIGAEIWRQHQARMAAQLAQARTGGPAPRWEALDPFSLRVLLCLLLLTGLIISGPARLLGAFELPSWPFSGPVITGWVTPPAYAGIAPYTIAPGADILVLTGTKISLLVSGPSYPPTVRLAGAKIPDTALDTKNFRAELTAKESGWLTIGPWWHRLAAWRVNVQPPAAPAVSVNASVQGETLTFSWKVADPYGLDTLSATIAPYGYAKALRWHLALPAQTDGTQKIDLSALPYYLVASDLTVTAKNLAGVTAAAPPFPFTEPLAPTSDRTVLAIMLLRKHLALQPDREAAFGADALKLAKSPRSQIASSADLHLAYTGAAMRGGAISPDAAEAALLKIQMEIATGIDFTMAQAREDADKALLNALRSGLNGQPPDSETLQKMLDAINQATANHLAASSAGPVTRIISMAAVNELARRIAADEAAGKTAQAGAELQQLAQLLQTLRTARPISAAQLAQAEAAAAAGQALSDTLRAEAALRDQTMQGGASADPQGKLAEGLAGIRRRLDESGYPAPDLAVAQQAMQQAQSALAAQNFSAAAAAESQAIQALQKALSGLPQMDQGGGSGQEAQGQNGDGASDDAPLPGQNPVPVNPADAIQQEIMKRDADPSLPESVHEYLRRLLNLDAQ